MKKRKITPHKGGRTDNIIMRVSKNERKIIDFAREKLSYSDYIVMKAQQDLKKKEQNGS